jgi:hypothetical protein
MNETDWIKQYFNESNNPADRTLVVLSVSLIDESLTELLQVHLKPNLVKNKEGSLFGFTLSCSAISTKIELAYRMRVIDKLLASALLTDKNALFML